MSVMFKMGHYYMFLLQKLKRRENPISEICKKFKAKVFCIFDKISCAFFSALFDAVEKSGNFNFFEIRFGSFLQEHKLSIIFSNIFTSCFLLKIWT